MSVHRKSQVSYKHMLECKNSNVEGDRLSTNKLQKLIAEYEVYAICTRDAGE